MLPILFQSPELTLYSYPLFMGLGWGLAHQVFFSLIPHGLARSRAQFLFWGSFLCSWFGAKAMFLVTVPEAARELMAQTSFWTGGGFVFYGGFLGGLAFLGLCFLGGFKLEREVLWAMLPALTLGHATGRIGCFLAGCCYGEVTDAWWGVFLHGHDRHPTQLVEAIGLFALSWHLLRSRRPRFELVAHYLMGYGLLRFGVELLRGDSIRGEWGWLTPSQWISLLGVAVALELFRRLRGEIC